MKSQAVNAWLSLLANFAVVAGIIFLGVELRQNNEALEAQSRYNHKESRTGYGIYIATNQQFSEVFAKARSGEALTVAEEIQYAHFADYVFATWEWEFHESLHGRLELPIRGYRETFKEPKIGEYWKATKHQFSKEFGDFIEREVIEN